MNAQEELEEIEAIIAMNGGAPNWLIDRCRERHAKRMAERQESCKSLSL